MKVFDLCCERKHSFEGWFGSAEQYEEQLSRGLIECPVCASRTIQKLLSAPRLNLASVERGAPVLAAQDTGVQGEAKTLQALVMKIAQVLVERTEDVGTQFASEARRIRDGQAPDRAIRGLASIQESKALREEGIEVFSCPVPESLKGSLH